MKAPCYNCPDRKLRCHLTCQKYIEYAEERAEIRKKRLEESNFVDYKCSRMYKICHDSYIKNRR